MKSNTYLKKECKRILNDATNIALGYVAKEEDKKLGCQVCAHNSIQFFG